MEDVRSHRGCPCVLELNWNSLVTNLRTISISFLSPFFIISPPARPSSLYLSLSAHTPVPSSTTNDEEGGTREEANERKGHVDVTPSVPRIKRVRDSSASFREQHSVGPSTRSETSRDRSL